MAPYRVHPLNLTYITQQALLKAPPPPHSQALVWSDLGSYALVVQGQRWGSVTGHLQSRSQHPQPIGQ